MDNNLLQWIVIGLILLLVAIVVIRRIYLAVRGKRKDNCAGCLLADKCRRNDDSDAKCIAGE